MKKRLTIVALRLFLWRIVLWWGRSLNITRVNGGPVDELRKNGKNFVIAFWHGSMFVGWLTHRPENGSRISALVSQSKDGEFLSSVLEKWGYSMIRGSSHIGGKEAMQLMVDAVTAGSSLAITPDGPRGPRHEMKMGALVAAQRGSVPLVLVGIAAGNKRFLRSWDKFEVPYPFSNVMLCYSDPVIIPKECLGAPLDALKREMQRTLNGLTAEAERRVEERKGKV